MFWESIIFLFVLHIVQHRSTSTITISNKTSCLGLLEIISIIIMKIITNIYTSIKALILVTSIAAAVTIAHTLPVISLWYFPVVVIKLTFLVFIPILDVLARTSDIIILNKSVVKTAPTAI